MQDKKAETKKIQKIQTHTKNRSSRFPNSNKCKYWYCTDGSQRKCPSNDRCPPGVYVGAITCWFQIDKRKYQYKLDEMEEK